MPATYDARPAPSHFYKDSEGTPELESAQHDAGIIDRPR